MTEAFFLITAFSIKKFRAKRKVTSPSLDGTELSVWIPRFTINVFISFMMVLSEGALYVSVLTSVSESCTVFA